MGDEITKTDDFPLIISVDDHVVEPPHVWQEYLPRAFHDRAPRIERRTVSHMAYRGGGVYEHEWGETGTPADVWVFDGTVLVHSPRVASAGFDKMDKTVTPMTYEQMRPGCYDPKARLADMDLNHVEASLSFPTFPRFCGQRFSETSDRELGLACIKAYNDWMVEEWCGDSDGRLIPLIMVPLWDGELAAAEVRRNAARGVRAVTFSEVPYHLGFPSIHQEHWDPFLAACDELDVSINMHIGSSSKMPATSPDAPLEVLTALTFNNAMASLADWLFSGRLLTYPNLKLAYSEGQIGWLPYMLERMDVVWSEHSGWGARLLPEPPTTYYRKHVTACFFRDQHGVDNLDIVGEDNVAFETDYPHTDSTWPHSRQVAQDMLAGLPAETIHKVIRGNAQRLFGLDPD